MRKHEKTMLNTPSIKAQRKNARQKGVTTLQVIMGIVLSGMFVAGALSLYQSTREGILVDRAKSELNMLSLQASRLYEAEGTYGNKSILRVLDNAGVLPKTLKITQLGKTKTVARNSWNGPVEIVGRELTFDVIYKEVPTSACIKLVTAKHSNAKTIAINNQTPEPMPMKVELASEQCVAKDKATITWGLN